MKRNKVGGVLAALANKHGIGKVVKTFPPSAMLSDSERSRVSAMLRGRINERRVAREAAGRVARTTPAPTPPRATIASPAGSDATREALTPQPFVPTSPLSLLRSAAGALGMDPLLANMTAHGWLESLSKTRLLPPEIRVAALDAMNDEPPNPDHDA